MRATSFVKSRLKSVRSAPTPFLPLLCRPRLGAAAQIRINVRLTRIDFDLASECATLAAMEKPKPIVTKTAAQRAEDFRRTAAAASAHMPDVAGETDIELLKAATRLQRGKP